MRNRFHPDNRTVDRVIKPNVYGEVYSCDRCGWDLHKKELVYRDGIYLCDECVDEPEDGKRGKRL